MDRLIKETINDLFLLKMGDLKSNPIIYPKKRDGETRISEQEAKQIFIGKVVDQGITYSVETPTKETYSFSGNTPLSAQIDLSLYPEGRQVDIEFKAHNVDIKNIMKDFEKLICEGNKGIFFHLIKNSNSGTIPSILNKYIKGITEGRKRKKVSSELSIVLICLNKRKYYTTSVDIENFNEDVFKKSFINS